MLAIPWILLALIAGLLIVFFSVQRAIRARPRLELAPEEKTATPLQRLSAWAVGIGLLVTACAVGLVVYYGPEAFDTSDAVRLSVTGVLIFGLALFTAFLVRVRLWLKREDGVLDERDRAILARAPSAQPGAMLITLAIWMIGLQETYRATGHLPVVYLYLIFWSLVVVDLVALPLGILLGYRRAS